MNTCNAQRVGQKRGRHRIGLSGGIPTEMWPPEEHRDQAIPQSETGSLAYFHPVSKPLSDKLSIATIIFTSDCWQLN